MAAAVVLVGACVERPMAPAADDGADAAVQEATGMVGAELSLPGGENLSTVSYTLTNGTNTYTGVVDLSGASSATFVLSNIASGSGYLLRLNAVSDDTNVACSGTSAPFAVSDRATTMVLVQLVCIVTHDAGGIVIGGTPVDCAVWNTIVANPFSAQAGGSVTLNAAATAPDPGAMTFTWTVTSGTGTISNNASTVTANDAGATDMATFTCPPTGGETDTIQLFVGDGPLPDGGSCPAADTTGTVQVTCGGGAPCINGVLASPNTATGSCPNGQVNSGFPNAVGNFCCTLGPPCLLGTGTEAKPNTATGTCPAGSVNIGQDSQGNYCCGSPCSQSTLVPCTGPNQYCCAPCAGSANGTCSPTEALLVAHDIANGKVTPDAGEAPGDCYSCLVNAGCLDDVTFGDTNHECGDFSGAVFAVGPAAGSADSTLCLDTLSCILRTSCAASGSASSCYCGTQPTNSCPLVGFGGVDGPCKLQELDGLSPIIPQILATFTDPSTPSGRVNNLFACATSNACTSCLTNGSGATPGCTLTFTNPTTDVTVSTVGGSTTIAQTFIASAPVTAVWSALAGTLSNEQQVGTSLSATFACPATGGAIPVTLVVNGGPRAGCPTFDNTVTTTVHCPGSSDAGADASDASSSPVCDASALAPCTSAGQTCCVPCSSSANGLCTPTEAAIVAQDIAKGNATTMGVSPSGCYSCLVNGGCIDDITFGDTGHECGDLVGVFDAGAQAGTAESSLCLTTLSCLLASPSCASAATSTCYCGTASVATACQGNPAPGPINGSCATQIANGLGYPPSDGTDITKHLTDQTKPAGMADQILQCALSNTCTACLQ